MLIERDNGDLALPLPAGSGIVMQTRFHPSGKAETEKGKLAIYFGDKEPSQKIVDIQVGTALNCFFATELVNGFQSLPLLCFQVERIGPSLQN